MHYHVGTYSERGNLIDTHGYTRNRERATIMRDSADEGQRLSAFVDEVNARRMRGAVIDDISDEDYTDREPRTFALPVYRHRVIECTISPSRCMATYETVTERRRSRNR